MTRQDVASYPDYTRATAACARYFRVAADWIALTNGLDEGLHAAAQAAAAAATAAVTAATPATTRRHDAANALVVEPAFEMYQACAEAAGLRVDRVTLRVDFSFPADDLLAAITPRTAIIYLNDPHNPTGQAMPASDVARIADAAPHALVLLDEAYAEFSGRSAIGPLLTAHPNLVVGRTFAKAHGLAGLRAGALIASPSTLAPIRRVLPPFGLNAMAARAIEAAIDDREYLEWFIAQADASRRLIYDFCARLGLTCWPSEANFVLVRVAPRASATDVVSALAARGILIRDRSTAPLCEGCVRIAAGEVDATIRCLAALEEVL
jgi:histidinol-phosphate aminotransferase